MSSPGPWDPESVKKQNDKVCDGEQLKVVVTEPRLGALDCPGLNPSSTPY